MLYHWKAPPKPAANPEKRRYLVNSAGQPQECTGIGLVSRFPFMDDAVVTDKQVLREKRMHIDAG